jgi:hypothetical protein
MISTMALVLALFSLPPATACEARPRYNRADFGPGWAGACLDTRERVLIAAATSVTLSADGCTIKKWSGLDIYTGKIYTDVSPGIFDVDHIYPLKNLWEDCERIRAMSRAELIGVANNLANLVPTLASVNRSKGDAGPSEWAPVERRDAKLDGGTAGLPPGYVGRGPSSGSCLYWRRWLAMAERFACRPPVADVAAAAAGVATCDLLDNLTDKAPAQ